MDSLKGASLEWVWDLESDLFGLNPISAIYNLCIFKQMILSLWALVMLSVKLSWGYFMGYDYT